jgi:nicotinamide-nucleotide amidase
MITTVAGSSAYYRGSVIAYANDIKTKLLGVSASDIEKHGAVSREVVSAMATGVHKLFNTDYALATSGIAGPDGGSDAKPVGTLWMAVASERGVVAVNQVLGNDRLMNIRRFSLSALNLLRKQIISSGQGSGRK